MKPTIQITTLTLFLTLALAALPSCNTTRGFGEDLQKLGSEIEDEAEETYDGR